MGRLRLSYEHTANGYYYLRGNYELVITNYEFVIYCVLRTA